MQLQGTHAVSGHVFCVQRKRGPQWYVKYRLPGGKQVQKRLGPAWVEAGSPLPCFYTKKTAQAALHALLTDARRGALPASMASGTTIRQAAEEWLPHCEWERGVKASTLSEYRSVVEAHIVPRFGDEPIESVTTRHIEAWAAELLATGRSRRTVNKVLTMLNGIFERARRVWDLPSNPVRDVTRKRDRYGGDLDFFSPEEVMRLVRAAASEQDGAIYLAAAFTGLRRGELLALRWQDLLFEQEAIRVRASYSYGAVTSPKSGRSRRVPMVSQVAERLIALRERGFLVEDDDLVFPGERGEFLDGSALRRRYKAALRKAGLRELRFHDLRHSFGSLAITSLSILEVQAALGHASLTTTTRYLHAKSKADEARRLAQAFMITAEEGSNRADVQTDAA
jgi:integrase